MAEEKKTTPDFSQGVSIDDLDSGGILLGHVGAEDVILVRQGEALFALGAHCTHYHGPLAQGLVVGDTIRCPWHHACFSLESGEAVRPPALDPVSCWRVERKGNTAFVRERLPAPDGRSEKASARSQSHPESVVIIGGGAAGLAAADMLRREGYAGPVTILSADDSPPSDRPNLSKDYLAGTAQEDWIPLRSPEYYEDNHLTLALNSRVSSIDTRAKRVHLEGGGVHEFGALLIATGADPVRLTVPGAEGRSVHYLRSFTDSRAIVAHARSGSRVVVVGASFIGLEVAASLRARDVGVSIVAPDDQPLERVMGAEVGRFIRELHESHGVVFHLGKTVARIEGQRVTLSDGTVLPAELVVVGIGVRPSIDLADRAGLTLDRGIAVNEYLETSAPGVFAAGDVARWPDPHSGSRLRVEHWIVAERQGQVAARNILGYRERFDAVPFFWSQHYDITINYVGHADKWDAVGIDGSLRDHDCTVTYRQGGRTLAVATVFRDRASLEVEAEMERS